MSTKSEKGLGLDFCCEDDVFIKILHNKNIFKCSRDVKLFPIASILKVASLHWLY